MRAEAVEGLECADCGAPMKLRESRYGPFYGCTRYPACEGTHGAHPDGSPLGEPADRETREARMQAHESFDRLWEDAPKLECYSPPTAPDARKKALKAIRGAARGRAYRWLAWAFDREGEDLHIGAMTKSECRHVRRIVDPYVRQCEKRGKNPAAGIRRWAKERDA